MEAAPQFLMRNSGLGGRLLAMERVFEVLDRWLSSSVGACFLIVTSYACAVLVLHPFDLMISAGELTFIAILAVWAITAAALVLWHMLLVYLVIPQILAVANVVLFFMVQDNCSGHRPCWFGF